MVETFETQWWNPSKTAVPNDKNKKVQVRHGEICAERSSLGSIGFLAHYGVANDSYFPIYNESHNHQGWDGPGWSADNQAINSPDLIIEAARRFLATTSCDTSSGGRCVIVFSSMLWDMGRHCIHLSNQSLGEWSVEFLANYSAVASALQAEISDTPGADLILTAGFPSSEKGPFLAPWTLPGGLDCHTPPAFQRATNAAARTAAIKLGIPLIDLAGIFGDVFFNALPSSYLRDFVHPLAHGLQLHWAAVRAVTSACFLRSNNASYQGLCVPSVPSVSNLESSPMPALRSRRELGYPEGAPSQSSPQDPIQNRAPMHLLLIGDSRDRFLYHEMLQDLCGGAGALTQWWNPSKTSCTN